MKKILVLTYGEDPHAKSVWDYLLKKQIDSSIIDTENLPKEYRLTFDSKSLLYKICSENENFVIDSSWNIWNRRVMNPDVRKIESRSLTDLIFDETEKAWDGLLSSHNGKVVNNPQNNYYANNKIDQIRFASHFNNDIKIPDTIVTNDPEKVKEFYDFHKGNICFKLHKGALIGTDEGGKFVYTNKVKKDDLKNLSLVSNHPCFFQEYIEKDFEVRIVSTDKDSEGIAIYSQEAEISKVDYRRYDFKNVPYKRIEVSNKIKEFCSSMLKNYGLHFGVFDFIKSKKGEDVFLELNPNGQWLWLELKSGYDLTKLVAENLIE